MTVRDCPTLVAYNGAYCCDIMKEGAYFSLNYNEVNFARLKKGLCGALNKVVADRELTLRAFIEPDELASIKNASYYNKKETFSLEINIYGLELDIDEVGRILSGDNIYLQFPRFGLGGYTYQNPHFLPIEGFSGAVPDTSSDPNQEENREENNRLQNSSSEASGAVSTTVDNILDAELTHHVDLGQISVDSRIKQTLRPHQIEAIDFISQRETGNLDSKLSLWKYNDVDQDEPFYQHVFTGAKRRNRMETKGGIIADEMGLGKTLVVLSTIAGTFDRAKKFVAENQPEEGQTLRKIPSQATLVIAPSSLLVDSWQSEIYKHTYPGAITFHKHLGPGRHGERHFLQQKMIVFTTYATVAIEHGRQKADSPLASINWFRIVLDEAHDIRNPTTKQFKAVSALTAQHRWCLTGTPIQNSLDDLGALSTFLKVPILESVPTFAKIIKNPVNTNAPNRFENLRVLLKTICLRRTRELLELPEPITTIRRVPLTNSEKAEYDDLLLQGQCSINMAVSGRRKARINSTVLEALLKLRLFCNNGKDFGNMPSGNRGIPEDPDEAIAYLQQLGQDICAYCNGAIYSLTEFEDTEGGKFIAKCPHLVCQNCLPQHREQNMQCPTCAVDDRNGTTELAQSSSSLSTTHLDRSDAARPYPSKLLALLRDLRGDRENKRYVNICHDTLPAANSGLALEPCFKGLYRSLTKSLGRLHTAQKCLYCLLTGTKYCILVLEEDTQYRRHSPETLPYPLQHDRRFSRIERPAERIG